MRTYLQKLLDILDTLRAHPTQGNSEKWDSKRRTLFSKLLCFDLANVAKVVLKCSVLKLLKRRKEDIVDTVLKVDVGFVDGEHLVGDLIPLAIV